MSSNNTERSLFGLNNLGNTCYMNSTLQCLLSSDFLRNKIDLINKSEHISKNNHVLKELANLSDKCDKKQNSVCSPSEFKKAISISPMFKGFSQQDAHELLLFIMDQITEKKYDGKYPIGKYIERTFAGKVKKYIKCLTCGYVKKNRQKYYDIVLPVKHMRDRKGIPEDIEECFKDFCDEGILQGNSQWNCPKCKVKVDAKMTSELETIPDVTFITFNRFIGMSKNNAPVKIYPEIILDGVQLKLKAVVNHFGGTHGGHYTATVLNNDKWYVADDSRIIQTNFSSVEKNASAYILMFEKVK